jgi:hypothetical protein
MATTTTLHMLAPRWVITGAGISTMASSWAWAHGLAGGITTAGVIEGSSAQEAVATQEALEATPVEVGAATPVDRVMPVAADMQVPVGKVVAHLAEDSTVLPALRVAATDFMVELDLRAEVADPVAVVNRKVAAVGTSVVEEDMGAVVARLVVMAAANTGAVDTGNK